jgi:hypothetical protein
MGQHASRIGEKKHENLKKRDHLEYIRVYGGIILKWTVNKLGNED